MTITTLSNDRCHQEFNSSRDLLLNKYHSLTKRALEHADYINTDDIAVLQAFVLFLVSSTMILGRIRLTTNQLSCRYRFKRMTRAEGHGQC
jgi:hypothetical protein